MPQNVNPTKLYFIMTYEIYDKYGILIYDISISGKYLEAIDTKCKVFRDFPTPDLQILVDLFNKKSGLTEKVQLEDLNMKYSYEKPFLVTPEEVSLVTPRVRLH